MPELTWKDVLDGDKAEALLPEVMRLGAQCGYAWVQFRGMVYAADGTCAGTTAQCGLSHSVLPVDAGEASRMWEAMSPSAASIAFAWEDVDRSPVVRAALGKLATVDVELSVHERALGTVTWTARATTGRVSLLTKGEALSYPQAEQQAEKSGSGLAALAFMSETAAVAWRAAR